MVIIVSISFFFFRLIEAGSAFTRNLCGKKNQRATRLGFGLADGGREEGDSAGAVVEEGAVEVLQWHTQPCGARPGLQQRDELLPQRGVVDGPSQNVCSFVGGRNFGQNLQRLIFPEILTIEREYINNLIISIQI